MDSVHGASWRVLHKVQSNCLEDGGQDGTKKVQVNEQRSRSFENEMRHVWFQ